VKNRTKGGRLHSAVVATLLATTSISGLAAAEPASEARHFSIAATDLHAALEQFSRQSGVDLVYSPDQVRTRQVSAVAGDLSPSAALDRLLRGTNLQYRFTGANTVVIMPAAARVDDQGGAGGGPTGPQSEAAAGNQDEIIVTAERRAANVQRVPITINTFSGEQLQAQGVDNTADLQARTPGFLMSSNIVFAQPYLRGIGNSTLTIGSDSSVAVHVDGVYMTRPAAAFQDLFDVERVEVLKGPQGTLYGRNATGGVINIITQAPTDTFTARGDLTLGNYNRVTVNGTISGPLSDNVAGRLTAMSSTRDGYVRNLYNGTRLEDEDVQAIRGALRFEPSSDLSITLSADALRERDTRGDGLKSVITGAGSAGYSIPPDPHDVRKDYQNHTNVDLAGASARVEWDLGDVTLHSLTAFRHSAFNLALDLDLSDNAHSYVDPETENSDTWTQEVSLASDGAGPFEWIAGVFYLNEDADTLFNIFQPGINTHPNGFNQTTAWATFGQASLWANDQLRFTLGGRYSEETKDARVITNFPAPTQTQTGEHSWSAFTPHASIDFFPTENTMLFLSATRGFKSGGFNATARGLPRFDPEFVWSYEGGVKSSFDEGRLRTNLSVFHYDYQDLQVRALVSGIISGVTNAAAATVDGAEAEVVYRPMDNTTFNLGVSYLDATFDDFPTTNPDVGPTPINLAGNSLPRAPNWQISFGAEHAFELGAGTLTVRGDWAYQSETFFDEFNDPTRRQKPFSTLAGRVTYEPAGAAWSLALWGRNLTDEDYITNTLRSAGTYGTAYQYGPPMTFGVTLSLHN
jgi:iron complex outermembrane recepter protein